MHQSLSVKKRKEKRLALPHLCRFFLFNKVLINNIFWCDNLCRFSGATSGPWSSHPAAHTSIWKYINDINCSLATVIFIKNIFFCVLHLLVSTRLQDPVVESSLWTNNRSQGTEVHSWGVSIIGYTPTWLNILILTRLRFEPNICTKSTCN